MSTGIKKISSKGLGLSLNVHENVSFLHFSIDPNNGKLLWPMGFFKFLRIPLGFWMHIALLFVDCDIVKNSQFKAKYDTILGRGVGIFLNLGGWQ